MSGSVPLWRTRTPIASSLRVSSRHFGVFTSTVMVSMREGRQRSSAALFVDPILSRKSSSGIVCCRNRGDNVISVSDGITGV